MASRGALIIRIAGDVRDLGKATVKASKQLEGVAKAAGLAGVAAGAALAAGVVGAINTDKANDKLAAGLGLSAKKSAQIGKVAGTLYKNAYGDSIEGVNDAVESVMSSIDGMSKASGKSLEAATAKALDFASAFEVDVARASQVAGQVVRTGLAKNATEAFDLMTAASQKVPKALREDVLDAADEYGQFFAGIGMNGKETFAALVKGAEKGQFGIDKIGDAVKEFTIRSTDMSKSSKDAYKTIGLDAESMANKMVKGGKSAGVATQDILKGLLAMEPGAKQANAAIALFGTPLEDLSVQEIPAFLKQLQGGGAALDGFAGSTKRMGKTLNDNAGTNLESFKRQVSSTFVEFVGGKALPVVNEIASTLATKFGPAVKSATEFLSRNTWVLKVLAVVLGALGAVLVTYHAMVVASAVATKTAAVMTGAWTVATKVASAAQVVWNAAMKVGAKAALGTRIQLAALAVQQKVSAVATAAWTVATKVATVASKGLFMAIGTGIKSIPIIGWIIAAVGALVWFFTSTKTGRKIVAAAWSGIKAAIGAVVGWWTKTAWPAIKRGLTILGAAFKSYLSLLKKIWIDGVWGTLRKVWGWIKRNVFDRFVLGLKVLRLAFLIARDRVSDAFASMRDRLARVGFWIRKNVFNKIGSALDAMRDGFRSARDGIAKIWDGLKRAAARPVNFLIKWVWNRGLRKVLNAIPGVSLPEVKEVKYARGGPVRGGTPGRDSVRALLMPGEEVWTAKEVRAAGGHGVMKQMRDAVLKGNLNGDPKFANGGHLSSQQISRAQVFANQQRGKPYGWGAVGPSAYDCSGFMSALTNVIRGRSPHSRVGSTASFPWSGFERGPGQFTIGSTPNYARSGVGHMAGNIAGLGVESRGGRGVLLGSNAMSPSSSGFAGMYHLGAKGKLGDASGGWLDTVSKVLSAMRKLPGQVQEMMAGGSWITPFLKKMASGLWSNIAGYLNKKIPDFGPIPNNPIPRGIPKFDNGGTLSPGYNTVYNGLGRPEPLRRADAQPEKTVNVDLGPALMKIIREEVRKKHGGNVQIALGRS